MIKYYRYFALFLFIFSVDYSYSQKNYGSQEIYGKWRMIEIKSDGNIKSELDVQVIFPEGEKSVMIENGHESEWNWELSRNRLEMLYIGCGPTLLTFQIQIKDNLMYWKYEDEIITLQRIE